MALVYTTQSDFEGYVAGWETTDAGALAILLERAQRDVDNYLGPLQPRLEDGLKLDPTILEDWEADALSRAVCAQAEYLFVRGPQATVAGRVVKDEEGPDFKAQYEDTGAAAAGSLIGPRVAIELAPIRHLRRLTATVA